MVEHKKISTTVKTNETENSDSTQKHDGNIFLKYQSHLFILKPINIHQRNK